MKLLTATLLFALTFIASPAHGQQRPDPAAQKAAMQKLKFLAGKWRGEAIVTLAEGKPLTLTQTEEVIYKLDGLLLQIEGTGRDPSGKVVFNAMAIVSYDSATSSYRIRAWNSGHFVETELKVGDKTFEWGFEQGPLTVKNRMTLDAKGKWSELSEAVHGGRKVHSTQMLLSPE